MAITLFEPFRNVFYAPFYAAHALDAYGEEGVEVRLKTASSPAATASGLDARVLGVGQEEDDDGITCVYVLDKGGQRYTAARNAGAYLLLDPALGIVAISKQFDRILQALKESL